MNPNRQVTGNDRFCSTPVGIGDHGVCSMQVFFKVGQAAVLPENFAGPGVLAADVQSDVDTGFYGLLRLPMGNIRGIEFDDMSAKHGFGLFHGHHLKAAAKDEFMSQI